MDELAQQYHPQIQPVDAPKKNLRRAVFLIGAIFFAFVLAFFWKGVNTLNVISGEGYTFPALPGYQNFTVKKENARIDVLILGIRGAKDPDGGLLTDVMMLASYNKTTGKTALVSIPRDMYIPMPGTGKEHKINFAYALGEEQSHGGGGLVLAKQAVSYLTGVYVDYAVSVNFNAFRRMVDLVDGITVKRTQPLREDKQWTQEGKEENPYWHIEIAEDGSQHWVFEVPAGTHALSGEDALYYVRSRYSTSDFDRMKRQQEVLSALKTKLLSVGILVNPLRLLEIMDILGDNVRTDMNTQTIREYLDIARNGYWNNVPMYALDGTNFLNSDSRDGQFVLLPKSGNLDNIRNFFKGILD